MSSYLWGPTVLQETCSHYHPPADKDWPSKPRLPTTYRDIRAARHWHSNTLHTQGWSLLFQSLPSPPWRWEQRISSSSEVTPSPPAKISVANNTHPPSFGLLLLLSSSSSSFLLSYQMMLLFLLESSEGIEHLWFSACSLSWIICHKR